MPVVDEAKGMSVAQGLVVVALALAGGQAVHWLLTPLDHPDASAARTVGVWIQAIAGFGGAVWAATRRPSAH
jgi:hypothetical protein